MTDSFFPGPLHGKLLLPATAAYKWALSPAGCSAHCFHIASVAYKTKIVKASTFFRKPSEGAKNQEGRNNLTFFPLPQSTTVAGFFHSGK